MGALAVHGNADRLDVIRAADSALADWNEARLGEARLAVAAAWPLTMELDIDGLGNVLVCHATPYSDEPIYTRITPDDELVELLGPVDADVLVCGHTHMQYDRLLSSGLRVVNPGSVGYPYEGRPGAYWALLGPDVEFRRTEYDVVATVAAIRELRSPVRRSSSRSSSIRRRRTRRRSTSSRSVARSYVREARRRGLGRRRERIGPIIERLAAEHSDAEIALRFRSDLELLVSVMLSAQTTDVNVNKVTPALFEKYRTPEDYLAVPVEELERDIYATGFFRQKAKSIRGTMRTLLEEFDGEVPGRLEDLVRLPGVARKTANVVASELGHAQGIVVDTHVRRLSQRLGLTRNDDPVKIERDLQRVVPRADWARFPHLLIWHGRRVCDARRPLCAGVRPRGSVPVEPTRRVI